MYLCEQSLFYTKCSLFEDVCVQTIRHKSHAKIYQQIQHIYNVMNMTIYKWLNLQMLNKYCVLIVSTFICLNKSFYSQSENVLVVKFGLLR